MKKIISIILPILSILLIFYLIYIRINLVGKEDMPDIVFMYSSNYERETFKQYVFDKDGNIYFSDKKEIYFLNDSELLDLYSSGELKNKMKLLGTIDSSELNKYFQLFLEIMHVGGVNLTSADYTVDAIMPQESWYGLYYNRKGNVESSLLYKDDSGEYYTNNPKADEIVQWMSKIIKKY